MSSVISRFAFVAALAPALLVGCASKPAGGVTPAAAPAAGVSAAPGTAARPRQDQQLITREVIVGTEYTNLYDVVLALRPNWLRTRGADLTTAPIELQVYLDNQRIGGVEELRNIPPSSVLSVRYYDPISAAARWGGTHMGGAIYVLGLKK